jgi:glycosyltransferase involved in cell wall biosynthesis
MKPLVSILIPAYNAEPFVADTIKSALAQTWPEKEIIVVVDDGCRDQTLAVARQFASKTVAVVARPHQSAAAARNEAYAICQGDYIQWLDADDLLSPEKIAGQMSAAEQCGSKRTLLSCAWAYFNFRPTKARFRPTLLWCDLAPAEWLLRKMGSNDHMQPATWLISRETSAAAGPWNAQILVDEDGEYFNRLVLASDGIRFVPDAKVFYRISGAGSYTRRALFNKTERWASIQLQLAQLRSLGDNERVRAACLNYLQTSLIYFYPESPEIEQQIQSLAVGLGGRLPVPRLRWKYAWLQRILGYEAAKRAQLMLPRCKLEAIRRWDKIMFDLEKKQAP